MTVILVEPCTMKLLLKDGNVSVAKGTHATPEITATADTADVLAVADGKPGPHPGFHAGQG